MADSPPNSFTSLRLSTPVLKALQILLFNTPTPVQAAVIPLMMNHKDVITQAVTGSGKTLAFLIPIIEMLLKTPLEKIQGIVISPTRELATQIYKVLTDILALMDTHLKALLVIGGTQISEDLAMFQKIKPNIIVATPGRLEELLKVKMVCTKDLEILVLDEADRLLDLGFERQLQSIISKIPKQRRTSLFSATMSEGLGRLVKAGLRNPVKVTVKVQVDGDEITEQRIPESLSINCLVCKPEEKIGHLLNLWDSNPHHKIIVYFANGASVDFFFKYLSSITSRSLHSLHGKMVPKKREATFAKFSSTPQSILLCTDVAARGIDLPDIDLVIQFDPPQDPKAFSHRCGRTARMGRVGQGTTFYFTKAIVFLNENEDTFQEFMNVRSIPNSSITLQSHFDIKLLQKAIEGDRDLYDKSVKAFVSYIRSYTAHQAKYIFDLQKLNVTSVMRLFGILKVPKMPELRGLDLGDFCESEVDLREIAYKDGKREEARKVRTPKKVVKKVKTVAWSEKKGVKERREERREKRERRRVAKSKAI